MSREIKFRAWNGKEMIPYTNWFTLYEQTVLCFEDREDHQYVDESDVDYPSRVTLMQYTGLHDKNGVEIYEGDIVKLNDYQLNVEWCDSAWQLIHKDRGLYCFLGEWDDYWDGNDKTKLEVIGNIYEDRELLK